MNEEKRTRPEPLPTTVEGPQPKGSGKDGPPRYRGGHGGRQTSKKRVNPGGNSWRIGQRRAERARYLTTFLDRASASREVLR